MGLYIIIGLFGAMGFTLAIGNHYYLRSACADYGLYNFSLWDFAHFHVHSAPMYGVYTHGYLSIVDDHFSIVLFCLVPFYWLFNWLTATYTLALIQVVFMMIAAWAVFKLVLLKTNEMWLAVLSVLYYYLLYGHFSVFSGDFNIGVIACCLVPIFLYLFETKRFVAATIVFVLTMLSKEIMPIWFVFIMLVLMIDHRKEKPIIKKSLLYLAGSVVIFVIIFKVFIPLIHRDGTPYSLFNYAVLGPDPAHAFIFIISHPIKVLCMLFTNTSGNNYFDGVKQEFYLVYLISGGFVLIFRPQYLLFFFPLILEKMLNDDPSRWSIEAHYSIETVTLLPLAVFFILGNIKSRNIKYAGAFLVCFLTGSMTVYKLHSSNHGLKWTNTVKENILSKRFFKPDYDVKEIHRELNLIPADAKVSASEHILPQLSERLFIYQFPDVQDADYIAVFALKDYYQIPDSAYRNFVHKYIFSPDWDVIAHTHDFILFKKQPNHVQPANIVALDWSGLSQDSIVNCLLNPNLNLWLDNSDKMYFIKEPNVHKQMTQYTCDMEKVSTDGDSLTASNNAKLQLQGTLTTEKARSGTHSVRLKFSVPFGLTNPLPHIKPGDIIALSVWRYSPKGEGVLALQFSNNKVVCSGTPVNKDSNGWEQLTASAIMPNNCSGASFYIWDNGTKPVYFDDLQVNILHR